MIDQGSPPPKRPKLVGAYIRDRRESLGLSQKALGQLFQPAVTTQFISNIERGVTPLPPSHIATLARALSVSETELLQVLEREYVQKLSGKLGRESAQQNSEALAVSFQGEEREFFASLYERYRRADEKTKKTFQSLCESIFGSK
jgi:transcriptional regulator with XRE-family HTH domain